MDLVVLVAPAVLVDLEVKHHQEDLENPEVQMVPEGLVVQGGQEDQEVPVDLKVHCRRVGLVGQGVPVDLMAQVGLVDQLRQVAQVRLEDL